MVKKYNFNGKLILVALIGLLFGSCSVTSYASPIKKQYDNYTDVSEQKSAGQTTAIKLNRTAVTLYYGRNKYYTLKAIVSGRNKAVRWKSSNEKVATVNSAGKISVKRVGTATISATVNGKSAKCKVVIKSRKATNLIYKKFLSQHKNYSKFQVIDIDRSGGEELLVSKDNYGYDVYTVKNKKIIKCGNVGDSYFWRDFTAHYSTVYKAVEGYTGGTGVAMRSLYGIGGNKKLKEKYFASISSMGTWGSKTYYQVLKGGKRKNVNKSVYDKYEAKYFGDLKSISLVGTSKSNIARILY